MKGQAMGDNDPLTAAEIELINTMEAPAHKNDFWARLDEQRSKSDQFDGGLEADAPDVATRLHTPRRPAIHDVELPAETHRSERSYRKLALVAAVVATLVAGSIVYQLVEADDSVEDVATVTEPLPTVTQTTIVDENEIPEPTSIEDEAVSSRGVEDPTLPTSPSSVVDNTPAAETIELNGADMVKLGQGDIKGAGFRMYSDGYIEQSVQLNGGNYQIQVRAIGYAKGGTFRPAMELRVDGQAVGQQFVEVGGFQTYTFDVSIAEGQRVIAVAFSNDPNRPTLDVDLEVSTITIQTVA